MEVSTLRRRSYSWAKVLGRKGLERRIRRTRLAPNKTFSTIPRSRFAILKEMHPCIGIQRFHRITYRSPYNYRYSVISCLSSHRRCCNFYVVLLSQASSIARVIGDYLLRYNDVVSKHVLVYRASNILSFAYSHFCQKFQCSGTVNKVLFSIHIYVYKRLIPGTLKYKELCCRQTGQTCTCL